MLPTHGDVPHLPSPAGGPRRPPTPGPLRVARVLVWIQVALWSVTAVLGVVLAASLATELDDGDEAAGWAGLGVFFGLAAAVLCAGAAVTLFVPVFLLRDRRPGPRPGVLVVLCVAQGLTALPALALVGWMRSGGFVSGLALLAALALAVTVIVLALQPASRAWAASA